NSATHAPIPISGPDGSSSRSNTETRIRTRRCCGLSEAFRLSTIPMSTSSRRKLWPGANGLRTPRELQKGVMRCQLSKNNCEPLRGSWPRARVLRTRRVLRRQPYRQTLTLLILTALTTNVVPYEKGWGEGRRIGIGEEQLSDCIEAVRVSDCYV